MCEGIRVIYSEDNRGQSGVAILLGDRVANCVTEIERSGDRLLSVRIQAFPVDIVIIQVYMPTTTHEEEEVDEIYETIEKRLENTKGKDYTIIMGDWNASVGEGEEEGYIGKYGLGKRNERGQKLVEFCRRQNMIATNTWFE